MYSVLSALTWRLIPPAAFFKLFSRDSAWAGIFVRSAIPSAQSVSVIIFARYRQPFAFASVKTFFIRSIGVNTTIGSSDQLWG